MQPKLKQFAARITIRLSYLMALCVLVVATGCQQPLFKNSSGLFGSLNQTPDFDVLLKQHQHTIPTESTIAERLATLAGETNPAAASPQQPHAVAATQFAQAQSQANSFQVQANPAQPNNVPSLPPQSNPAHFGTAQTKPTSTPPQNNTIVRAQSPSYGDSNADGQQQDGQVQQAGGVAGLGSGTRSGDIEQTAFQGTGAPGGYYPLGQGDGPGGSPPLIQNYADLDVYVAETQTGRINFGGAFNSDNGIVGQFVIDEKNFDITRWPRNFREILDGTAWRGGGQTFRLELAPGANLERYLVSITEPYWLGTDYSFSASGYLFDRAYFDWDESRLGGRFSIGRRLTPDLSISAGLRLESVTVDNARVTTSDQLNDTLGTSNLFLGNVGLIRDTRDSTVQATEGSYLALTVSQAFGDFTYTRGDLDYRRYRLLYERPDGSGRHTMSFSTKLGFSGSETPIFENYFAGGFTTLRGFDFRGAAPLEGGVRVGGEFQWLNSVEYVFPVTADDSIKGVLFCDFGTVEEDIEINSENFRVVPGFGFRVSAPGAGFGAPLAFDFAFPVSTADGDDEKVFSFYLGVLR